MLLLDEIEQHDDVADDDADEACDSENSQEAHGLSSHPEARECAGRAEWDAGEHDERFHRVLELEHERQVDRDNRRNHHTNDRRCPFNCSFSSPDDLESIAGRQLLFEIADLRHQVVTSSAR